MRFKEQESPIPLDYANLSLIRSSRRFKIIGTASFIVGLLSTLIFGAVILGEFGEFSRMQQDHLRRPEAYKAEFENRHQNAMLIIMINVPLLLLGVMLVYAGGLLYRLNIRGIVLLRFYARSQLLASVLLSIILMEVIYNSPAGMLFFLGIVPGFIACIYPLIVLSLLRVEPRMSD
jgi:hypothetical protein